MREKMSDLVMVNMQKAIRVKHYSLSTERAYMDWAKRGPKLPVVFTIEEVRQLFSCMEGKQLLIVQILYEASLRLMELARLRVKDLDFGSGLIFVRSTKGDKDRSTILPESREPVNGFCSLFYLRLPTSE